MRLTKQLKMGGIGLGAVCGCLLLVGSYSGGAVTNGGSVSGTISIPADFAALPVHVVEDPALAAFCGDTVANDEVVSGEAGELANAVVWIDGIESGKAAVPGELVLDQVGCIYAPRIAAAVVRSQLTITSSDETLHNTHGVTGQRTVFNLAIPTAGVEIDRRLNRPGVIDIKCDAGHTWMAAVVHVFEHPYFAVTGADGRFELGDVPPGTYSLHVWHEHFEEQIHEVTVTEGGVTTLDTSLAAE